MVDNLSASFLSCSYTKKLMIFLHAIQDDETDWMGDEKEALAGFSWRGGAERETTGVLLWNKPFICKLPTGEEVL